MMRLELYAAGTQETVNKCTQYGIGIVLMSHDNYNRSQAIDLGFLVNGSNQNIIEIQAARLALSSVIPQYRRYQTILHTASSQVIKCLAEFSADAQIIEFKRWHSYYSNIVIQLETSPLINLNKAKQLAKQAATEMKNYESKPYLIQK